MFLLVYIISRVLKLPQRLRRCGKQDKARFGSATSEANACPAPVLWDICGLPVGHTSRYFPMTVRDCSPFDGTNNFSNEAAPASISPQNKMTELIKLIKILASLDPLSRDAIKLYCSDPHLKSCVKSSSGSRGVRVQFHPRTVEPRITQRKARRFSPQELPSSAKDRWLFPREVFREMSSLWRTSAIKARIEASDLEDDVWHLWLSSETGETDGQSGSAAAGSRKAQPLTLGSISFIVDTGCGHNLIAERYVRAAGAMRMVRQLKESITLNTAGGASKALGSVRIACPNFSGGDFDALVMPKTPAVLSVGERCMDHGFSFYWPTRKNPYFVLPDGTVVRLTVEGKIPYLTLSGREALGRWMCAVAAEEPATLERWSCASIGTKDFLDIADVMGAAPPPCAVRTRVTTDMHTQELIATHSYTDGKPDTSEQKFPT